MKRARPSLPACFSNSRSVLIESRTCSQTQGSSPNYVVKNNNPADFTILAPGQTYELTHNLAGVYNFTNTGAGEFKVCRVPGKIERRLLILHKG